MSQFRGRVWAVRGVVVLDALYEPIKMFSRRKKTVEICYAENFFEGRRGGTSSFFMNTLFVSVMIVGCPLDHYMKTWNESQSSMLNAVCAYSDQEPEIHKHSIWHQLAGPLAGWMNMMRNMWWQKGEISRRIEKKTPFDGSSRSLPVAEVGPDQVHSPCTDTS